MFDILAIKTVDRDMQQVLFEMNEVVVTTQLVGEKEAT